MSGATGQAMPTQNAEQARPASVFNNYTGGGKGGGQAMPTTAMGTPIISGQTFLPQSQMAVNQPVARSPLSVPQQEVYTGPGSYIYEGGYGA